MKVIQLKRIYEHADVNDGCRILVDRLWPRGISKEKAQLDHWMKDLAPSDALRKWYRHDPQKFEEFKTRYKKELQETERKELLSQLLTISEQQKITLLFAAKDEQYNQAVILKEILEQ